MIFNYLDLFLFSFTIFFQFYFVLSLISHFSPDISRYFCSYIFLVFFFILFYFRCVLFISFFVFFLFFYHYSFLDFIHFIFHFQLFPYFIKYFILFPLSVNSIFLHFHELAFLFFHGRLNEIWLQRVPLHFLFTFLSFLSSIFNYILIDSNFCKPNFFLSLFLWKTSFPSTFISTFFCFHPSLLKMKTIAQFQLKDAEFYNCSPFFFSLIYFFLFSICCSSDFDISVAVNPREFNAAAKWPPWLKLDSTQESFTSSINRKISLSFRREMKSSSGKTTSFFFLS